MGARVLRRRFPEELLGAAPRTGTPAGNPGSGGALGTELDTGGEAGSGATAEPVAGAGGLTRQASAVVAAGNPTAHIRVAGEVRTINPDDPSGPARLWGRGRVDAEVHGEFNIVAPRPCTNGSTRYGLSTVAVDWGSAADACPAGTWVCSVLDIIFDTCNTTRPDNSGDYIDCSGDQVDLTPTSHLGWTADPAAGQEQLEGLAKRENASGVVFRMESCSTLPVWCCWN